jgi:hypothetical protein
MQHTELDKLDQALAALPREVEPSRDLWPAIRAELKPMEAQPKRIVGSPRMWQLAAGIVLMALSSVVTYVIVRSEPAQHVATAPAANTSGAGDALALEYLRARADLDRVFAERVAKLPPATRAKIENNLAELRRAADQLTATLAEHPSDALLHELLMSTRQRELQLLADISQIDSPIS